MTIFTFITTVAIVGPILDLSTVFLTVPFIAKETVLPIFASGLPVNLTQATCSSITVLLFGEVILEKLDRVKQQYGILES